MKQMKKGDYVRCTNEKDEQKYGNVYRLVSVSGGGEVGLEGVGGSFGQRFFEPAKVAVLCKTQEEWNAVISRGESKCKMDWSDAQKYENLCIYIGGSCDRKVHCLERGYHIISASEYLGGEIVDAEVTEKFRKFGTDSFVAMDIHCKECGNKYAIHDDVVCPAPSKVILHHTPMRTTIRTGLPDLQSLGRGVKDLLSKPNPILDDMAEDLEDALLYGTSIVRAPWARRHTELTDFFKNLTGGNKMNNSQSNIDKVFADNKHKEVKAVERFYSAAMLEEILMETHKAEILRRCKAKQKDSDDADKKDCCD